MELSVVILNYNVRHFLELCLESVTKAIASIDAEIIVVDNNSSDDSTDMVSTLFPSVKLIENTSNLGFSKGNNIGVAEASGKYVCILNPDTVVAENTFTELLQFSEGQSNLGIVGCKLIDGRGRFLPESKRNIPLPKVALKKMLGNSRDYYATTIAESQVGRVDVLVGAFMLMRRSIYDAVKGFDEDYFMYGEDIDISYKVSKKGYKNYYYGKVSTLHFKGESTLRDAGYAKRFYGAMKIFYKKHFKKNPIFDLMVSFGITLAHSLRRVEPKVDISYNRIVLFTKTVTLDLNSYFDKDVRASSNLNETIDKDTLVIYDTNSIPILDALTHMVAHSSRPNILFRFLSNKHTFILGSDSSIQRGEIIETTR